jgi:uncharacterized protein (TIGR00369 family)
VELTPKSDNGCFGCGGANPRGMQLTFEQDDAARKIRGRFSLDAHYEGAPGFIHGGVIATLLDEVMSKANRFRQARAVTAELNVEYLRPVRTGQQLVVEGWETEAQGRNIFLAGEIRDAAAGTVLARGRGRFVDLDAPRNGGKSEQVKVSVSPRTETH